MQLLHLVAVAQQREHAVADQIGGRLLSSHHGHNRVGDHLLFAEPIPIDFRRHQRVDQPITWMLLVLADGGAEVDDHLFQAAHDARGGLGGMLEVAEHLGKVA